MELGLRYISVNSICFGFFFSKMSNGLLEMSGGYDVFVNVNLMRRLGRLEDIVGVIVYLCSWVSNYVNGVDFVIDGGVMWVRG